MFHSKNFIFLFLYTTLLTVLLFLVVSIFFTSSGEEEHIEPYGNTSLAFEEENGFYSFSGTSQEEVQKRVLELIRKKYQEEALLEKSPQENPIQEVEFRFIPKSIQKKAEDSLIPLVESFLSFPEITPNLSSIGVYLYENIGEVRGRMKSQVIHMFGVGSMDETEFLSVFIHEFGHYFDIYTLEKTTFGDQSQRFYDISWESQTRMKKQAAQSDFVSGYAMTNQYEDFAESYVYYVLHNKDFYSRAQGSILLREKYDFFEKYVFTKKDFFKEDFSPDAEVKNYYWDITKIPIDIEKFLQYLQKEI